MALGYYNFDWGPLQHLNYPETNANCFPQAQSVLAMELLGFQENYFYPEYPCIDPLFEPNDLILPHLALPPPPPPPPLHDNSIPQQFDLYPYLYPYTKCQKTYEDKYLYPDDLMPCLVDGFVPNPPVLLDFSPGTQFPSLEFYGPPPLPPVIDYGRGVGEATGGKKGGGGGGESLSAQSIAARQRRRKITEKTQELGKLIPGGHKMNTAEMFQAASKYIKFLQAQVGVLEFVGSIQENEEPLHTQELRELASSPTIQEKLYSIEKCLVPKQLV